VFSTPVVRKFRSIRKDYLARIAAPMDLQTLGSNVESGRYAYDVSPAGWEV